MLMDATNRESNANNFEENYINRVAIFLKPLQPCIDWVNNLYTNNPIDESDVANVHIYLIHDHMLDIEAHLK